MTLAAGSCLGSHEIVAPIGAAGMGEVFRARDTKLNRDVAIKVLPAAFAQDQERVARFKREALERSSCRLPLTKVVREAGLEPLKEHETKLRLGSQDGELSRLGEAAGRHSRPLFKFRSVTICRPLAASTERPSVPQPKGSSVSGSLVAFRDRSVDDSERRSGRTGRHDAERCGFRADVEP